MTNVIFYNMPSIYIAPLLKDLIKLYARILYDYDLTIVVRLRRQAEILWEAFQTHQNVACIEINNYHRDHLGKKPAELFNAKLSFEDILETIAQEYGYESWKKVEQLGNEKQNYKFEKAIDTLLSGDIKALKILISNYPELIHQTSQYPHQATLLHYVSSNGFEIHRQVVPSNLVEITTFLLKAGADPNAKMKVYGGEFEVKSLIATSAHPKAAGIVDDLLGLFP